MEYGKIDLGLAGLKKGVGNAIVTTRAAAEAILFGAPVFVTKGEQETAHAATGANRTILGVAISTAKEGVAPFQYNVGEPVNILTRGVVLVPVADAVDANAPAYLTAAGAWTDQANDGATPPVANLATGYTFRTNAAALALAELEIK